MNATAQKMTTDQMIARAAPYAKQQKEIMKAHAGIAKLCGDQRKFARYNHDLDAAAGNRGMVNDITGNGISVVHEVLRTEHSVFITEIDRRGGTIKSVTGFGHYLDDAIDNAIALFEAAAPKSLPRK